MRSYNQKLQREVTRVENFLNNSLSLRGATPPSRRHPPFLGGNEGTYQERIFKYIKANVPASIKAITKDKDIKAKPVNVTTHIGKGKVSKHLLDKRTWAVNHDLGNRALSVPATSKK